MYFIVNFEKLKIEMQQSNCLACDRPPPVDIHHIKTRGSGGKDVPWNIIPLCRTCHINWHRKGSVKFCQLNPSVTQYLKSIGWETYPKLYNALNYYD